MAKNGSFSRFDRHGELSLSQVIIKSQGLTTKAMLDFKSNIMEFTSS